MFRLGGVRVSVSKELTALSGALFCTDSEVNAIFGTKVLFFKSARRMVKAPLYAPKSHRPSGSLTGVASVKWNDCFQKFSPNPTDTLLSGFNLISLSLLTITNSPSSSTTVFVMSEGKPVFVLNCLKSNCSLSRSLVIIWFSPPLSVHTNILPLLSSIT